MNSVPAEMAELADALVSGTSDQEILQVQVLFSAPNQHNPNNIFPVGDWFGFFHEAALFLIETTGRLFK